MVESIVPASVCRFVLCITHVKRLLSFILIVFFPFQDEDYVKCSQESAEIERIYSPYFDASILNEDIDLAYEELLQVIRQHTTGQQWVPTDWIY